MPTSTPSRATLESMLDLLATSPGWDEVRRCAAAVLGADSCWLTGPGWSSNASGAKPASGTHTSGHWTLHWHGAEVSHVPAVAYLLRTEAARRLAEDEPPVSWRDITTDALCVHRDDQILDVNEGMARLFGRSQELLVGAHLSDLLAPEVFPRLVALTRAEEGLPYETMMFTIDGRSVPLEARTVSITVGGSPARMTSFRDMSRQKQTEEVLDAHRQSAEAMNRRKGLFLAEISQTLRTPMNTVLGIAQLLRTHTLPEETRELLGQLDGSTRGVLALLDDLLDLGGLEDGTLSLNPRDFHLGFLVEAGLMAVDAPREGVEVSWSIIAETPTWWHGDDLRIQQILVQLLNNAVEHTHHGTIEVMAQSLDDGLCFRVKDTGTGMAPRTWRRFFGGGAEEHAGMGLGYCIDLARKMGGDLACETILGAGTEFLLTLPCRPVSTTEHLDPLDADVFQDSLRVLLAEDNPVNQMVISKLVTQLGHEISSVSSGLEAIEAAEQGDFHVVLMDLEMPQMDGVSATEALRDHGYLRPIIALTAHTMRAELDRCLDAGMDACLTKPVRLEDLQLALNRYGHQ